MATIVADHRRTECCEFSAVRPGKASDLLLPTAMELSRFVRRTGRRPAEMQEGESDSSAGEYSSEVRHRAG